MIDQFEELLHELSNLLGVSLKPDQNHACTILIDDKLKVQLELHKEKKNLILGAHVSLINPGRFRENVLIEALKENDKPYPLMGVFGYSLHNNQLALFDYLEMDGLTGEKLADYLTLFIAKASEWKEAIENGQSCPLPKG